MAIGNILTLLVGASSSERKDFTGYQVIRVPVSNEEQARHILDLKQFKEVDIWMLPKTTGLAEILIPPAVFKNVSGILDTLKLKFTVEIPNLQEQIDNERLENAYSMRKHNSIFRYGKADLQQINSYFATLPQIHDWMNKAASQYSSIANIYSIGRTHEGKDLKVLKVGAGGNKPVIWIDGGIHAREWIAPSTVIFMALELISGYASGKTRALVDKYEWHFLPVVNPDGYAYTHEMNRMWRKNRRPSESWRSCYGVDPNRNFAFHWAERGGVSSNNPCEETYHGPYAASEYEAYYMQEQLKTFKGRFQLYVSLHSYAQMLFVPYGYSRWENPPDYSENLRVANEVQRAVYGVHRRQYQVGKPGELLYSAGGGSYDYAKGVAGARYSFTFELRPTHAESRNGFIVSPSFIRPAGEEIWAGLIKMTESMRQ